jgi:hypothetical protein
MRPISALSGTLSADRRAPAAPRPADHDGRSDAGAALVSALFVLVLMAGLTAGLTALIITDTKVRSLDGTRTQSFYVAHAGLERLTAALGDLFNTNYAPTGAQINALTATTPGLGAVWQEPDGTSGYKITFPQDGAGNPLATVMSVLNGPFMGLVGLATPYRMSVTARLPDGSEAELTRTLQTVSIPVFQFGLFSENDLSFFAGPNFNFGGRVHSNANVFLASGDGSTLTLADRITSVGEVIRQNLSNGWATSASYNGTVNVIQAPGTFRALSFTEGSLVAGLGSSQNEPVWTNLSTGTYNHNLMNGRTGARRLDLPVVNFGGTPIDIIRRPPVNENVTNPNLLAERFYSMASVRILLSDTAADITSLPTVTAVAPVPLGIAEPWALDSTHFPFAESPGPLAGVAATDRRYGVRTPAGTPQLGGFIKIEKQTPAGVWQDVTLEILNLGVSGRQLDVAGCAQISPNAIVRIQRLRDGLNGGACVTEAANPTVVWSGASAAHNYSPNTLYDTREGVLRDGTVDTAPLQFGGIVHYIEVDVNNLRRWLLGQIGANGTNTMNITGYVLYFSDRRGNRNAANVETGEYGFEDVVNPLSATGAPNGVLDVGEDFNNNGTLETYGQTPRAPATVPGGPATAWGVMASPLLAAATPWGNVDPGNAYVPAEEMAIAQRNPAIFFRRALKLTNGTLGNIIAPGLTVVSENPVYLQGNWNATNAGYGNPHVATAVIADSLTLLSNNWNDRTSYLNPHAAAPRAATTTWYRLAVIAGKGPAFTRPTAGAVPQDYGTDGGAHNFLRYIENWGGQVLNYRGSIASLYFTRQATGTYKCCADVYSPPTRGYNFDVEFLTPALLPPRTPMFRDVNITGFAQIIKP